MDTCGGVSGANCTRIRIGYVSDTGYKGFWKNPSNIGHRRGDNRAGQIGFGSDGSGRVSLTFLKKRIGPD
jgi:hypothetical protein